jgi:hypothetical protein
MLSWTPLLPPRDEKRKHQPCTQKTMPELEIDEGPRAKGGRASIGKPTYIMKTHKPNQFFFFKCHLKPPKGSPTLPKKKWKSNKGPTKANPTLKKINYFLCLCQFFFYHSLHVVEIKRRNASFSLHFIICYFSFLSSMIIPNILTSSITTFENMWT